MAEKTLESFHIVKSTKISVHSVEKNSWAVFEKTTNRVVKIFLSLF